MIRVVKAAVIVAVLVGVASCSRDHTPVGAQRSPGPGIVPVPAAVVVASPTPDNPFALYIKAADGVLVPDPTITPGHAADGATVALVCQPGYGTGLRHAEYGARAAAFADYAVPWSDRKQYQVDNLIPVILGGDNSKSNLWPMPLVGRATPQLKASLAAQLRALVCAHQLPLASAQAAIVANWWAAYQTYGGTTSVVRAVPNTTCSPLGAKGQTKSGKPANCIATPRGAVWAFLAPSPPPAGAAKTHPRVATVSPLASQSGK